MLARHDVGRRKRTCGRTESAPVRKQGKLDTSEKNQGTHDTDSADPIEETQGASQGDMGGKGCKPTDVQENPGDESCKPGPQSWGYVPFGHSGGGYPDLEYVKIGAGWDHVGDLLRNTNTLMKITGADGNWYALSDSAAYSSDTAPDNKADTYYTTKALLDQAKTPTAFAVYSADDQSLDFYKRPRYLMPVSGNAFEGKAATAVYTGFETTSYGKKEGSDSYIP